jgi:hypothetical protein
MLIYVTLLQKESLFQWALVQRVFRSSREEGGVYARHLSQNINRPKLLKPGAE